MFVWDDHRHARSTCERGGGCDKLARVLPHGEALPDHICKTTMRSSCWEWVGDNHVFYGDERVQIPIPGGLSYITKCTTEFPCEEGLSWPVDVGNGLQLLFVIRQWVSLDTQIKLTETLEATPQWENAVVKLRDGMHMAHNDPRQLNFLAEIFLEDYKFVPSPTIVARLVASATENEKPTLSDQTIAGSVLLNTFALTQVLGGKLRVQVRYNVEGDTVFDGSSLHELPRVIQNHQNKCREWIQAQFDTPNQEAKVPRGRAAKQDCLSRLVAMRLKGEISSDEDYVQRAANECYAEYLKFLVDKGEQANQKTKGIYVKLVRKRLNDARAREETKNPKVVGD